ncbi:MAG: hypothetical protein R6U61_07320 [Thermoplasmata archaeon]
MKIDVMVIMVIILTLLMAGCSNPPKPPASELPKLTVDYDLNYDEDDIIIFYIHGIEETRYSNISLHINEELIAFKNNSFSLEHKMEFQNFSINVDVWLLNKHYNYNATYEPSEKEDIIYEVTYYDGDTIEIGLDDFPFTERINLMEEPENA